MALSTSQVRRAWSAYKCNRKGWKEITFLGRKPVRIIDICEDAWHALEVVLIASGYPKTVPNVGSYNCRVVRDSARASLHAYRVAVDVDPGHNPRKRWGTTRQKWWQWSKLTRTQVDAALAIRTVSGARVFTHGGSFRSQDPMHFQIACSPAAIKSGINWKTVKGSSTHHETGRRTTPAPATGTHPVLRQTAKNVSESKRRATKELQTALNAKGADPELRVDGKFGQGTATAVRAFQKRMKLTVDGIVGRRTWMALDEV